VNTDVVAVRVLDVVQRVLLRVELDRQAVLDAVVPITKPGRPDDAASVVLQDEGEAGALARPLTVLEGEYRLEAGHYALLLQVPRRAGAAGEALREPNLVRRDLAVSAGGDFAVEEGAGRRRIPVVPERLGSGGDDVAGQGNSRVDLEVVRSSSACIAVGVEDVHARR